MKMPQYEVSGNVVYRKGKIFGSFDPTGGITIPDYWDRIAWEIDVQTEFAAIEEEAVKYLQEGSKS